MRIMHRAPRIPASSRPRLHHSCPCRQQTAPSSAPHQLPQLREHLNWTAASGPDASLSLLDHAFDATSRRTRLVLRCPSCPGRENPWIWRYRERSATRGRAPLPKEGRGDSAEKKHVVLRLGPLAPFSTALCPRQTNTMSGGGRHGNRRSVASVQVGRWMRGICNLTNTLGPRFHISPHAVPALLIRRLAHVLTCMRRCGGASVSEARCWAYCV